MSGRFLLLGSILYMLFFAAIATLHGGPMILALPLVVYLGMALLNRPPNVQLKIERIIAHEILPFRAETKIRLLITNEGAHLEEVFIQDLLPRGMQVVDGDTIALASMPHGETLEMSYTVRAPRGGYEWENVLVTAGDHLGVLRRRLYLPAPGRLIFLPDPPRVRKILIRPPRTHGHSGPIPSRKSGTGVDFMGLREYQMGDPRRWINWRASARHENQLFVNQFEQERIADVGIILDARQQADVVLRNGEALFEHSVRATGAVAETFLNDGNRVGLLIYGFGMERVFPGYGKVQYKRISRALGQARTGHNFALESLRYLPTRFFPAGSQIVMVTPLQSNDLPAFTRLRATGYEVMVISPDPVDFEARALGIYGDLAWQIAKIERALLLHKLRRMGVRVLDWDVTKPFEPLVRNAFSRMPPVRRTVVS